MQTIKARIKELENNHRAIIQKARDGDAGAKAEVADIGAKVESLLKLERDGFASTDDIIGQLNLFGSVEEQLRGEVDKMDAIEAAKKAADKKAAAKKAADKKAADKEK